MRLEGIDDRTAAVALGRPELWVERAELPALSPGEHYRADLVGFEVVNLQGVRLGRVEGFLDLPANPVMIVAGDRERWMSYFADDFAEEMPAGSPATKAPETLVNAWEAAFGPEGTGWRLDALKVITSGNEIAVYGRYPGTVGGEPLELESIEVWTVDDTLKAHYCRAWFLPFGS